MSDPAHLFTVSPDFSARAIPAWFLFNTWIQRALDLPFHLELATDFAAHEAAIASGRIDLVYANPFEATALIRRHGFTAVAVAKGRSDETVVAVRADSPVQCIEDLAPGVRLASVDDWAVHVIGMILLEPADLRAETVALRACSGYVIVAKELLRGNADVGFFPRDTFGELSQVVRAQLRVLATSQISVVRHVLLLGPRLAARREGLLAQLRSMSDNDKGAGVLASLGFDGWDALTQNDVEFMIDLIDTLVQPAG